MTPEPLSNLMETSSKHCIPLNVLFELTYNCNLNCCHCYIDKDKRREEFSTEEARNILDQLADAGTLYLTLSGGEVFTRRDFFEIVNYAKKKHFAITIFTNGTLITEEIAQEIADLCLLNVGISVYGASPEIHEGVTGVKGSFEKSLCALQFLRERGVHTTLKCTLMKQNFEQYPKIIELAKNTGAGISFDPIVTPSSDGCKENLKYRLSPEQLKTIFTADENFVNMKNDARRTTHDARNYDFLCDAGRNFCSISPYGDVYPCVQLLVRAGNLRESSFLEIWSPQRSPLRRPAEEAWRPAEGAGILQKLRAIKIEDLPICSHCKMFSICNRCPGLALLEEGDLLGPSRIACTIASVIVEK